LKGTHATAVAEVQPQHQQFARHNSSLTMKFAACALTWMKLSLPMHSANIVVSVLTRIGLNLMLK
jgi:hypothetical protein